MAFAGRTGDRAGSAFAFLYTKTTSHDVSAFFEDVSLLRQLKQLDAQWELDVLKSRLGTHVDYDALVDPLAELTHLQEQIQSALTGGDHAAPAALRDGSEAFARAIVEKTRLIEHFKSHNSVLRNSLAFLPTAAGDVTEPRDGVAIGEGISDRIADRVNAVLLASLVYSQNPSDDKALQIDADLRRLLVREATRPVAREERLAVFAAHVRTVLREQPLVDGLLKDIAAVPVAARIDNLDNLLGAEQRDNASQDRQYRMYLLLFAAATAGLLVYVAVGLIRSHAEINRVNAALLRSNAELECRVEERTSELSVAQDKLVASARQAGMAEIATNVLHNVGNVLNSVNVSAGLIGTRLAASRAKGLARAIALMDEHEHELGDYLTRDAKGRLLPGYLRGLSRSIDEEQRGMVDELDGLCKSVDHIKEIVATQQSYAGTSSVVEAARVGDLVDDALRISAGLAGRGAIEVVKDIAELPSLWVDRHRVVQILVNLLSNARHAFESSSNDTQRITVCAESPEQGTLRICVADNGEGIANDHLDRIFSHGFTTRKNGHGFGLHSCVIAAQEMGGSLAAQSEGPGRGAVFTLLLPMQPNGGTS